MQNEKFQKQCENDDEEKECSRSMNSVSTEKKVKNIGNLMLFLELVYIVLINWERQFKSCEKCITDVYFIDFFTWKE